MVRKTIIVVACALAVAGCGDRGRPNNYLGRPMELRAEVGAPSPPGSGSQQFSYTHTWSVRMAHAAVSPRFTRTRDLCLRDKALDCKLVSASITLGDGTPDSYTFASLEVQLPHDRLAGFERALLAPAGGEKFGDAVIASRQTQAQSVETQASDTARKVAQLTAYRDRLAALEKRPNLSIDDLIRLESEASRVQSDLDAATGLQQTLNDGIAREDVTIQMSETVERGGPIAEAWRDSGFTLEDSAASALRFAIGAIPWLPILAAGIYAVSWLWRLFRRRQKAIVPAG